MVVTSADQVRPHVQTVTTYAADFDEIQTIELDGDDVDEWQYAFTDVAETVYESQVHLKVIPVCMPYGISSKHVQIELPSCSTHALYQYVGRMVPSSNRMAWHERCTFCARCPVIPFRFGTDVG